MRKLAAIALPLVALIAAGCSGSGSAATRTATTPATSQHPATASPSSPSSASPVMTASERLFANGMAASIADIPDRAVSGPVMHAYIRFEHDYGSADGDVGQPDASGTLFPVPGGFKVCSTGSDASSACSIFTQIRYNRRGQITGLSVDGKPVAGRIATAPSATSGGLTISDVASYALSSAQDVVVVTFKLTDSSYRPVNTSPALLASLSGASDDTGKDALPATLEPGDSLYGAAAFDVSGITGLFCLQPNDGFGERLPCTTLRLA